MTDTTEPNVTLNLELLTHLIDKSAKNQSKELHNTKDFYLVQEGTSRIVDGVPQIEFVVLSVEKGKELELKENQTIVKKLVGEKEESK